MGCGFIVNGLFMVVKPESWYWSLETVPQTGPFNAHFVRDIGLMYVLTGISVLLGLHQPENRVVWWVGAALWHVAHGGLHIYETIVGISTPEALAQDFAPVVLPGLILIFLARQPRNPNLL